MEVGNLLLWGAREHVEKEADYLDLCWVLWVPLEVGLLKFVVGQSVEVVDVPFGTIV